MGQIIHGAISYDFFDSIGKHLPISKIARIDSEAQEAAQKVLSETSGTSYHLAIAIGYKLAQIKEWDDDK